MDYRPKNSASAAFRRLLVSVYAYGWYLHFRRPATPTDYMARRKKSSAFLITRQTLFRDDVGSKSAEPARYVGDGRVHLHSFRRVVYVIAFAS